MLAVAGIASGGGPVSILPIQSASAPTTGAFHGCPVSGLGGDAILNTLENRAEMPDKATTASVSEIAAWPVPSASTTGLARSLWPAADTALAAAREETAVTVEGYVVDQNWRGWGIRIAPGVDQGLQPQNCNSHRYRDLRLWIAAQQDQPRSQAIVAVATPRWQEANPGWNEPIFAWLAQQRTPVRVTGMVLYANDEVHDWLSHDRITLWTLHPITDIKLLQDGK